MAKVIELKEALHTKGETNDPSPNNKLDRSNRQPHSAHLKASGEENNLIPPREEDLLEKEQRREGKTMTSTY